MRSLYKRELTMMVGIVALSFTLLSTAFMLLSYRYIISETRDRLERNAGYIAAATSDYLQNVDSLSLLDGIKWTLYQSTMETVSAVSEASVIVTNTQGEILYATDSDLYHKQIPERVVQQIIQQGHYNGITNLGGIYGANRYIAGLPVQTKLTPNLAANLGLVLVSGDTSGLSEMWRATATIFFFAAVVVLLIAVIASSITSAHQTRPLTEMAEAARKFGRGEFDTATIFFFAAVVVLLIAVIASSITSAHQTRPLTEMAEAARKFGRGEFDVRVNSYKDRCDEIEELAEAFNSMANSLEKVESQRADFIANVSHELKTPMTTIAGFAEGILDGTIPQEKEREALNVVVSETRRLSRLVRRMLDLSRLNALAETVTAQEQFDITEIMSRVLVSLEGRITGRGLDVDAQFPEDPVMVWGDPDAVTQVCYNLLDNAAKFAAQGTDITVQIAKKDGKALITVRNLGATIPPDELPLLFERFHKADYSRSVDREGVGLGLYIVKTILGNLKENITATSEDGVTQFTFTLTLA